MLRSALVAVGLLVSCGFVVALVNAQDFVQRTSETSGNRQRVGGPSLREPASFPLNSPGTAARPLDGVAAPSAVGGTGGLRSVLKRPAPAAASPPLEAQPGSVGTAAEGAYEPSPSDAASGALGVADSGALPAGATASAGASAAPVGQFEPVANEGVSSRRGFGSPALAPPLGNEPLGAPQLGAPQLGAPQLGSGDGSPAELNRVPSEPQLDAPGVYAAPAMEGPGAERFAARPEVARGPAETESQAESTLILAQAPRVSVRTRGPSAIVLGKQAQYRVEVVNEGNAVSRGVGVRVTLPASAHLLGSATRQGTADANSGAGAVVWNVGELAPGGRGVLTLDLVARQAANFRLGVELDVQPLVAEAQVRVQEPKLDISISGPKDVLHGETKIYTLTLTNPGTGDAENVTVSLGDSRTPAASKPLGTLAAGERRELDIELTAREAGPMEIRALAIADGGLRSEAAFSVQVRRAQLQVELAGPPRRFAGSQATYEVLVANTGDAVAEQVVASLVIPEGVRYVGGVTGGRQEAGRISWPVGLLNPSAQKKFQLQFDLTVPGDNRFEARVLATGDLAAASAVVTQVEALADLKLLVNDPRGPKSVGEEVEYEVTVVNRGTKAARNIDIVAQFSEGIEPVKVAGGRAELVPGQVIFETLPEIAPGQQVVLKVIARAEKEGNHIFRTEVKCGNPETRLVTEETTRYFAAGMVGP